ncbi:MFS transporter [Nocardioides bruguierae]|uniref:MFS transporter n=1 Tax=Nocardioides bruguierae TaxID=2945102 RepID=UPI00201FC3DB|nr:MFS transporter [Nocardioides bruguierae]MCL8026541.1 MFS transporter [Nocardioides bruguierae]
MTTQQQPAPPPTSLLAPAYRSATIGSLTLVFLIAFEALAVATVMPVVAADLGGRSLFAVAFSATLAAGIVGMVAGGAWADRVGATRPMLVAVATFAAGLLLAGLAPTMPALVVGRFLQGLGGGAAQVTVYVLVGQVYAPADRSRILGAFAAAWVLPGLVGPFLAGLVTDLVGWRWVFLGVVVLAALALALLVPALRRASAASPGSSAAPTPDRDTGTPDDGGPVVTRAATRLALAAVVAGAVLGLNLASALEGAARPVVAVAAVLVALAAVRPLLPPGTLRASRGIPAVVAFRGLVAGGYFAAESYLPYLLQDRYGAAPAVAGLVLTVAATSWAAASQVQGRATGVSDDRALRVGASLLVAGVAVQVLVAAAPLPGLAAGVLAAGGWLLSAAGMGWSYPRVTANVLGRTPPAQHGTASAAVTIADSLGAATAVALAGVVFTALAAEAVAEPVPFAGAFALALVWALLALLVSRRSTAA